MSSTPFRRPENGSKPPRCGCLSVFSSMLTNNVLKDEACSPDDFMINLVFVDRSDRLFGNGERPTQAEGNLQSLVSDSRRQCQESLLPQAPQATASGVRPHHGRLRR